MFAKRKESVRPMKRNLRQERGNSLIEFSLLLPVFLLLVLGVFDFGNGYNTYIGMANAAREGAMWLERYPDDRGGMEARINEEVGRVGLNSGSINIQLEPDKVSFDSQEMVTVTVESNYPLLFGAITEFSNITLRTQTVVRVR